MDIHRFTELALAHGATRERWPRPDRALYDRFAATPEGMAALADAERIDAFLDGWQPRADDAGRVARIVRAATANDAGDAVAAPVARTVVVPSRRVAAWLSTGFVASALFGFVLGFTQASTNSDDEAYIDLLLGSNTVMEEFL
ncbi:MAG: hypothetical protein KBG29_06350 [Pseudomonadales bacterium]|nr:hypothetical protein [Pseudomonadales bacterium]MBP9033499.1 hypothetical protein [Pseudomonadales bacterium]